jgi:hypothetical protein
MVKRVIREINHHEANRFGKPSREKSRYVDGL